MLPQNNALAEISSLPIFFWSSHRLSGSNEHEINTASLDVRIDNRVRRKAMGQDPIISEMTEDAESESFNVEHPIE
jgi:hypothetical protein